MSFLQEALAPRVEFSGAASGFNATAGEKMSKSFGTGFIDGMKKAHARRMAAFKKEEKDKANKKKTMRKKALMATMDVVGMFMQLASAMGVLQPFMEVFQGILSVIGGSVMEMLAPAMEKLFGILFSPEMMELWGMLGELFAAFLVPIIEIFGDVLLALMPILKPIIKVLMLLAIPLKIVGLVIKNLGLIFMWIGKTVLLGFLYALYGLGMAVAAIVWVLTLGFVNLFDGMQNFFGPIISAIQTKPVPGVWQMATGGYVGPSAGGTIIRVAEGGEGEFIVPESKMEGNEKVVWAIEDLGTKMDRTNNILRMGTRLR